MFHKALLIIPINIKFDDIQFLLANAKNYVIEKVFVELYADNNFTSEAIPNLSQLIIRIYQDSLKMLPETDLIVHIRNIRDAKNFGVVCNPDVILFGMKEFPQELRDNYAAMYACSNLIDIGEEVESKRVVCLNNTTGEIYNTVVLGGTFDRLHAGHKILLTESVLRSRKRVVVGVTDENMVRKGKVLPELILPVKNRIQDVLEFLMLVDNTLKYEVVPISDPFGPTATDPDMDMIVVSKETYSGGKKINEVRAQKGFNQLKIHSIPLVDHYHKTLIDTYLNVDEKKVSSSRNRYDLLGKYLKSNRTPDTMYKDSYIIGLIENRPGDKSLEKLLKTKDVAVLQCDSDELQKCIESIHEYSIQSKADVIFLSIDIKSELVRICQEVWCCLSSEKYVDEIVLETCDVLFTSSIPLEPQINKAWQSLIKRINLYTK